jgi:hypothetical protein
MNPTILLASGRYFDFTAPTPITINEVSHGLSNICRFTGHSSEFYSVAQHSVLVSYLVPPKLAMWGLLHDAAEAVMGDMSSPLKKLLPQYKELENRVEEVILRGFGLHGTKPPEIKHADLVALRTEQRDLMRKEGGMWINLDGIEPVPSPIIPLKPLNAEVMFLSRYHYLHSITRAAA